MDTGPLLGKEEGIPPRVPRGKIAPFPVIKIIAIRLVACTRHGSSPGSASLPGWVAEWSIDSLAPARLPRLRNLSGPFPRPVLRTLGKRVYLYR